MSWPGEDWTVGLTGHVLQKVKQLQAQNEKLTKERQQRQLQLDNSEAALHKQKQKHEEVRADLTAVQRELGGVREAALVEVRVRERLAHDLQVKTGQVHSLEGQLESSKNLSQNLTQEIKRLEAELEKLQKGNGSGDSMMFSTPCWNMSSPWDHSGGFRAEGDGKAQHVRQQLQFGEIPKPVAGGASSAFPKQPQESPPIRRHTRQSEASTPSSMFPWERDDLRSTPKGRPAPCVSSGDVIKSEDSGIEEALRNEIDALRVRVSELQREALLESERLKDVDSRLAQAQRDINTKEQSLTRTQDQLTRAQTRITEETDRVHAVEQKVKHLQEELKCQRQNAESSRCNAEQRRKDMEREHQRELLEQQRERQALEKQHQQEINRLNQEIQQARTLHNTLQAQHDKVCLQKQGLERDLEDVKGKLKNTEADLKESQKRETQTEAKLTEALRENENLTVSLGQVKKQEKALQEEVKRLTDELAEALKLIKELQAQLAVPPQPVSVPHFGSTGDCLSPAVSFHHDRSLPYQPSTQRKRAPQTGRTREEERMKYPSGREPGEGIDSEHIGNSGSEESQRFRAKGVDTQQSCSLKRSDTDGDISLTEQDTGIEDVDTDSFMSDSTLSTRSNSESGITRNLQEVTHDTTGNVEKHDSASLKDLKKENSQLRDELKDVNYELQKRLDDLESQRRAEAEARTKLKQLSRKHSTQTEQQRAKALELKDSMAKLEAQLEQETKEVTKLRENLDVLEREAEKRQDEKEREQDESAERKEVLAEMEQKEEEMERMRKELEDLQRKLKQEREEREQEREEERKKIRKEEAEGLKIAQLQEELDNLRRLGQLEDNISKENFPVAYLQLDRHINTSNKDSPESICDSVNLHNTMICQETRAVELIMDLGAQTKPGTTAEGKTEIEEPLAVSLDDTTVVVLQMERLRVERDQEAENAKLAQGKLEDMQKQVNTQTKHLTHAFESQSKNIENLLRELNIKECALQRQAEELQKCQEKITLLEETRADREDVVFGEVSKPPEPYTEISRELSCDSVISNMSVSDQEMFNDDTQQILKDSSLQLPVEHSISPNIEQTNTTDASDKIQIAIEAFNPHELNCECPPSSSVNSEGLEHSQVFTESAQETENLSVTSNRSLNEQVQNVSEEDDSELERVTKELQEAENQLNVMTTQNETPGLVDEELLSVKRELKAKLRGLEKDTCADRTSKEDQSNQKVNEEGFLDGSSSGLEESVVPDETSEDKGIEEMREKAEGHDLHKQIQTLQEQIQNLSVQNRTQAEELQKCQEKITLLEETRADREDVVFGEVSKPPEPYTEISRELSCDSVISNMSVSDQEMFNDDTQQILKDSSLQLPVEHSISPNIEQTNTTDASDKIQTATEAFNPHELNCECPPSSSVNSEGLEHSQVFTESAQETENLSVTSNRSLDEQVQNVSEEDDSELERVTKELQETENQLNVTPGLVDEELLSVKRELKAKLRGLEKDTCADRTSKEDQSNQKVNEEGFLDGSSSGLEESVVPDETSEDKGIEGMREKAEGHDLHKQIQTLQEQIQNLSVQNRTQAEELNLWKITAMGETADSSSPSITLREFEIFIPCNSTKPYTQQTRTTDMTYQCGSEDGKEQTNLPETQITHDGSRSQGDAEVLLTENETMITENVQEFAAISVTRKDETPPDCTSHMTTSDNKDGLSDLQQIALLSPVSHGDTTGAGANSQEDASINISISSECQTKVINTEPITKSREIHDSQNSALLTARNQMETKETFALDKHGDPDGEATDKQNNHHVAEEDSASQTNEPSKGQRAESDKVNGDGNGKEIREVQSVSTQTEESGELSDTTVKRSLVHIGTQTDTVQLETDEEEGHEGPADSLPLSRTLQTVTNPLLLSKAFPMSDPAHLAERIRQNRNRMSAAYDDTEYEPYGLPEVVMKGFADIPSGPACPYVLRRGLLGTDAMPLPLKEAKPQDEDEDIEP